MKKNVSLTLVLCILLLCGCTAPAQNNPVATAQPTQAAAQTIAPAPTTDPAPVSVLLKDLLGNEVEISGAPTRVISLSPTTTEILFALGAGDSLIGVDTSSDYPAEAAAIPKIADLNAAIAAAPDLVFTPDDEDMIKTLEANGICAVCAQADTYGDIYPGIALVAQIMGKDASSLIQTMQQEIDAVAAQAEALLPQSVCCIVGISEGGYTVAGPGSFLNSLVETAGGLPATSEALEPWPILSAEQLVALNPQVLLVSSEYALDTIYNAIMPGEISAISQGRVFSIEAELLTRPGPRVGQAAQAIYEALEQAELS